MKRRMKSAKGKAAHVKSMMGSAEPFKKQAKKPEADDRPHMKSGPRSVNKGKPSPRTKRLTGLML